MILLSVNFCCSQINSDLNKLEINFSDDLCEAHLEYFENSLNQGVLWAEIMKDSWGNFPSGTFAGNYFDFGHYDQCIRFTHDSVSNGIFHGQYCTVTFSHRIPTKDRRGRFAPSMR